jgi:hypothetical protein
MGNLRQEDRFVARVSGSKPHETVSIRAVCFYVAATRHSEMSPSGTTQLRWSPASRSAY